MLNAMFGIETVIVICIIIAILILCFIFLPKMQKDSHKNKEILDANKTDNSLFDKAINQIVEREELIEDLELLAVISAAIAASTGASSDEFIVRSIKRAKTSNRWQKA